MSLSRNVTSNNYFALLMLAGGSIRAQQSLSGALGIATSGGTVMTAGTWYHCAAVFTSSVLRTVYLNGVAFNNTTSIAGGTVNTTAIGTNFQASATAQNVLNGAVAYADILNVALSSTDITALYNAGGGSDPRLVQNISIVSFSQFQTGSPYPDEISGSNWTITGTPTVVADPFSLNAFPSGTGTVLVTGSVNPTLSTSLIGSVGATGTAALTLAPPGLTGSVAVTGVIKQGLGPNVTGAVTLTGSGAVTLSLKIAATIGISGITGAVPVVQPSLIGLVAFSGTSNPSLAPKLAGSIGVAGALSITLTGSISLTLAGSVSVTGTPGVKAVAQPQLTGGVGVSGALRISIISEGIDQPLGVSGVLSIQFAGTIALSGMTGTIGISGLVSPSMGLGLSGQMSLLGSVKPSIRAPGHGSVGLSGFVAVTLTGAVVAGGPCPGMRIMASVQRYNKSTVRVLDPKTGTVTLVK